MKRYVTRRLAYSMLSLVLLSITIFFFVRVTGDPAVLLVEPGASKADLDAVREQFGLDRPLIVQYFSFVGSLLRGNFGQSFYYRTEHPRALHVASTELAAARPGRDGVLAHHRDPERRARRGAREHVVGQRRGRSSPCSACPCPHSGSASS